MGDKIDRAAAMERFPDGRQPWPEASHEQTH
jgi:hypothetical protein